MPALSYFLALMHSQGGWVGMKPNLAAYGVTFGGAVRTCEDARHAM
jgi:hypothetical protein